MCIHTVHVFRLGMCYTHTYGRLGKRTVLVGAEIGGAAVASVAGHGARPDLHHVRRALLQTLDAGRAALGRHGVSDGLRLVLPGDR